MNISVKNKFINKGTFGRERITYNLFHSKKKSARYFIFFHGAFSSFINNKIFSALTEKILSNNLGNVFLFETSRKISRFESLLNFDEYKKTFSGKNFSNEVEDIKIAFSYLINHLIKNKAESQFNFIGFSLGGTLSSYLIEKYNNRINNIFLFGSGISTKDIKSPILSTYPKEEEILKNFAIYKGNLFLIQATKDVRVPIDEARKIIFNSEKCNKRELIILKGVDHRFKEIDGKPQEEKLIAFIFNLIKHRVTEARL